MKTIDDKEVGEIWKFYRNGNKTIGALIRKLVAERARWYKENHKVNPEIQAILDFGIHPADWKDDD